MSDNSTRTLLRPRAPRPPSLTATVVGGASAGMAARGKTVTVGRSRMADLALPDFTVSEFHVELTTHETGIEVRDLESSNGTFHAGTQILRGIVPAGATLSIGQTTIQVAVDNAPETVIAPTRESFGKLIGRSQAMLELFAALERLAATELSVFIEGPTGSGKELVAQALHDAGPRASGPFVVLDCASFPATLAESVLFGHAAGAFTGASTARPGVFETASGGTVFLDEIGDLPIELQPKLLRVLESRKVTRVGENRPRDVSMRVVCATWRDLRAMINQGRFRDDLFYRLAQTRVVIPSLKERREDIELLATSFLDRLPRNVPCARTLSRDALSALITRDYPGNVRELRNVVERAAFMSDTNVIRASDLAFERLLQREQNERTRAPDAMSGGIEPDLSEVLEFKDAKRTAVDDFERDYLVRVMTRAGGNIAQAATRAGIERHHLRALLKKHGLYAPADRG